MATAVQTSSQSTTPNPHLKLVIASLFGAAFLIAGVAVTAYLVPSLWKQSVSPTISASAQFFDVAARLLVQLASVGAVVYVGSTLAGANPPRGLRGGIFLALSALISIFFIVRAVGLNTEDTGFGAVVTLVTLGGLLGLGYRALVSDKAASWMVSLEEQGWFSTFSYKRMQGQKTRRYTLIGLLIIGWTGVYTLISHYTLGTGDWNLSIPFTGPPHLAIPLLSDIEYSVPVLVAVLTFWLAWRAVNVPPFADFLIATEAEMNKVSWSTRKRLVQDTIVVLVTCFVLTAFLLAVDLFWGWLLSRELVGVLPPRSSTPAGVAADPLQGKNVDW